MKPIAEDFEDFTRSVLGASAPLVPAYYRGLMQDAFYAGYGLGLQVTPEDTMPAVLDVTEHIRSRAARKKP